MGFERNHKKNNLMAFERKVLRRVFDPRKRWYMENYNKRRIR
jgi:hypothetical protein